MKLLHIFWHSASAFLCFTVLLCFRARWPKFFPRIVICDTYNNAEVLSTRKLLATLEKT